MIKLAVVLGSSGIIGGIGIFANQQAIDERVIANTDELEKRRAAVDSIDVMQLRIENVEKNTEEILEILRENDD